MLGSKPSRDAGNPPVIKLAQAVRIERTWASFRATLGYQQPTPEEIWRAVKESNPADRFWRPVSPQGTTRIGGRRSISIHTPVRVPLAFEARVRACALHLPELAESGPLEGHAA